MSIKGIITASFLLIWSGQVLAQNVETAGVPDISSGPAAVANAVDPVGVSRLEIFRLFSQKQRTTFTASWMPQNWPKLGFAFQGSLGFVSRTPFAGSFPLYHCLNRNAHDMFTSADPNCEGHTGESFAGWYPVIGEVASSQLPGTIPLYRCYYLPESYHYDTLSANCEGRAGAVMDGILGYVFL